MHGEERLRMLAIFEKGSGGGWDRSGLESRLVKRILKSAGVWPHGDLVDAEGVGRGVKKGIQAEPVTYLAKLESRKDFERDFIGIMPVMIRREALGETGWKAFQRWTRKGLMHRYGNEKVQLGIIPYGAQYGRESRSGLH